MKTIFRSFVAFSILIAISASNGKGQSGYLVLTSASDTTSLYYKAAETLKNYRNGQLLIFNPVLVDTLLPVLQNIGPRYVALVMKPEEIYINFVRRFLMMSTKLDDDPFSDFSYGYITGATGQDALNFVNNIIKAESEHAQYLPLTIGGYAASNVNLVYTKPGDYFKYLNPQSYSQIYLQASDSATGVNYFLANTPHMLNKKLLNIGHNGDPHMLWLFEGGNMNPNPTVWVFDSTKIEDPAFARPGLTSQIIGSLNLYPAVAFNGACHAGVPKRVLVEGDIAATFGHTQGFVRFYNMSDTFSFALSILKTGLTGYFAACGANNANDEGEELYSAFLYNEPLGDVHKRNIDGVVMGFLGNRPNLRLFSEWATTGQSDVLPSGTFNPSQWSGASSMLGGKANRIYFGCPMYHPFKFDSSDSLKITKSVVDSIEPNTVDITVTFKRPDNKVAYFPTWDKFHYGKTRVYIPVELPDWCNNVSNVSVVNSSGPYSMVIHAVEHFLGKTILHIEIDIPDDLYGQVDLSVKLRVNVFMSVDEKMSSKGFVSVYPNPATDHLNISFSNPEHEVYTLKLYNSNGQEVLSKPGITGDNDRISLQELPAGLYLYKLYGSNKTIPGGRLLIR